MKKYVLFTSLILLLITACSTVVEIAKEETELKSKPFKNYQDRIIILDFGNANFTDSDSLKNKIEHEFISASKQNFDAVIFSSNSLSKLLLTFSIEELKSINILRFAGDLAKSNGLDFFVEVSFDELNRTAFPPFRNMIIKNNFNLLVKNCVLDGFYFSGINFSSKDENDLFEDIVVESALLKPYLIISIPGKLNYADETLVKKYLEKGVIDFLIDNTRESSIEYNKYLNANEDEKILKNYMKRFSPDHFITLNLSEVIDKGNTEEIILNETRTKQIDHSMKISFIETEKKDTIKLKIGGAIYNLSKDDWAIPYNYLLNKDNTVSRYGTWVEFRRPFASTTTNNTYNLLCKTNYPSKVFINNDSVKIYKTGVFFKKIKLNEGLNKLRAEVKDDNGNSAIYEDRVLLVKQDPLKSASQLNISDNSIEPSEDITLMPEDYLSVSFNGTKSQKGFVEIIPSGLTFECSRTDYNAFGHYKVQIPLKNFSHKLNYNIKLILKSTENNSNLNSFEKILRHNLIIKEFLDFPLLTTTSDNSILTFTLAPIRLGAPVRNELPKNVILKSNGIFGEYYRVHLSDTEEGYINREFVKELPAASIIPSYFINPIVGNPSETADIIKIPYLENVPYDVYPDPSQKRIIINLYGVKTSSTWIIHRKELRYVDEITWQQTSKETYKIYINLKTSKIWGYDIKQNERELIFRIKYPPTFDLETNLPLKGIKFSIEAGHGGSNLGAIGLSGLKEKDINLKLSKMLESLLRKYGAEVLQVRDSDIDMTLIEKRDIVTNSDANIHLSIHANSSEPTNEFLGTSGTCTFYHNPFWAILAEKIYNKLIELDLKPFGSVGSFNYRVTRMSDMPAILVEQAFMSQAEDEEKLYDDNFRQQMAEKICSGIIDYLRYMKD